MAISVGNTADSGVLASSSSTTFALNNNKEDVIVLVALRDTRTSATVTATYAGAAMTEDKTNLYTDDDSTADLRVYVFRKTGATTGSNNVVVTFSNAIDHGGAWALAVAGISSTGQPETTAVGSNNNASQTNPDLSVTTTTADCLLVDVVYDKTDTDLSAGSSQTIISQLQVNGGGDKAVGAYKIVSASGANAINWTSTNKDDWDAALVAYKIAAVATTKVLVIS